MATYTIEPERRTLHGKFSRDFPPVLTIYSGDTVVYRTLDAGWNRSEEHTSELQSQSNLVCRLLLEKKNDPHLERTAGSAPQSAPYKPGEPPWSAAFWVALCSRNALVLFPFPVGAALVNTCLPPGTR